MRETRQLTEREAELLGHLLTADFPGVEELREQAKDARAVAEALPEGVYPTTIKLEIPEHSQRATSVQPVPVLAQTTAPSTSPWAGEVLLFVRDGRLALLEFAYVGSTPTEFPPIELVGPPKVRPG